MNKHMPSVGLVSGLPDGWVPGDDDDPRIERQIDHETEIVVQMHEHYDDVVEHSAGNMPFTDALHSLFRNLRKLRKPMDLSEQQALIAEYVKDGEQLLNAFEDVARIRVGEFVEKGESYIYRGSDHE